MDQKFFKYVPIKENIYLKNLEKIQFYCPLKYASILNTAFMNNKREAYKLVYVLAVV